LKEKPADYEGQKYGEGSTNEEYHRDSLLQ